MGEIFRQTKREIRQLPFMLGKLVGGVLVIVGVTALVLIGSRRSNLLLWDLAPYFFAALIGIMLFLFCSRALARCLKENSAHTVSTRDSLRMNIVAWSLLLLLVVVFLLGVFLGMR
ncbi:MAG: hypothetical protein PHO83_03635 [Geobacteraceae bacterium]|nr:hypothetical protein [Geobacteraceae bacterium]